MKRVCLVVLAAEGAVVVLTALMGMLWLRHGISARAEPSDLESAVARRLRHWAIPAGARARANPEPATPDALREGGEHFADHCAQCHGNDGAGDTAMGRGLYPRAPDMRLPATQDLSDGELFWIIENGVRLTGMPAWGGSDDARVSWQLVHFLRHLPTLTPEEKREMEELNPKSPEAWRELDEENAFLKGSPAPRERDAAEQRAGPKGAHRHGG